VEKGQEPTVTAAEIENAPDVAWNEFQQDGFAFDAMGNLVSACEVFQGVFGGGVFVHVHIGCGQERPSTEVEIWPPRLNQKLNSVTY